MEQQLTNVGFSSKHDDETAFGCLGLNSFDSPLSTTEFTDPITRGQRCNPLSCQHVVDAALHIAV